jgi:hypothetical protein
MEKNELDGQTSHAEVSHRNSRKAFLWKVQQNDISDEVINCNHDSSILGVFIRSWLVAIDILHLECKSLLRRHHHFHFIDE